MKTAKSRHQGHTAWNLIKDWLFTLNLFFILYSLVTLAAFLLGPRSGRVSTLVCKPDPWGKLVCTVKIYGIHKLFRLDFYADDYIDVLQSSSYNPGNYPRPYLNDLSLPWDNVPDESADNETVCAVSIRTQRQLVDFVPPYQTSSLCSQAEAQLEAAFAGDRSAIDLRFNGLNPSVNWRIELIAIASILLLAQLAVRLILWRREKSATAVAEDQNGDAQLGTKDNLTMTDFQPVVEKGPPAGRGRLKFILFWWGATALLILFFIFFALLIGKVGRHIPYVGCYLSIKDYRKLLAIFPLLNLINLSPVIAVMTLLAALQWLVVRTEIRISRWWIAAPVLVSIPMLLGLPPASTCMQTEEVLLPILESDAYSHTAFTWIIVYLLLIGIIQWLVLRRKLRNSIGWIIIPILSVCVEVFLFVFLGFLVMSEIPYLLPDKYILDVITGLLITIGILATMINLVPGYYLYRLILARRKKLLPDLSI